MGFQIQNGVLKEYTEEPGITEVTIPDGVTVIGRRAFADCKKLTSVTIPESVTKIDWSAFGGCESLTSVTIPDGVTVIGSGAFADCKKLTSVTIPESVTKIDGGAFMGCTSLTSVIVAPNNTAYASEDNLLLNKSKNLVVFCPQGLTSVTIPDSVTEIGKYAFYGCTRLTSVTIPDSVTEIGYKAFEDCTSLTSVIIAPNNTAYASEDNLLLNKSKNLVVFCPQGLTSVTIPDSVTDIGKYVFKGCTRLTSVTLGKGIVCIAEDAFKYCKESIRFLTPNGLPVVSEDTVKKFIVPNWKRFEPELIAQIFINKHSKPCLKLYAGFSGDRLSAVGKEIPGQLGDKPSAKLCSAAADFVTMYYTAVDCSVLKPIYDAVKSFKTGAKAAAAIEAVGPAMKKMGISSDEPETNKVEKAVLTKDSESKILARFKNLYKISAADLPAITDTDGKELSNVVLAWLLVVNDEMDGYYPVYKKPGYSPESAEILGMIDHASMQAALMKICSDFLGGTRENAKHHLAYPLCRYADEETLAELIDRATWWKSSTSGINAPPFREFRYACKYSTSKQAVFFAEKYNDLGEYAWIRGTDADTIRDTVLSDVGLAVDGTKQYDLGNQTVTVRMQPDYSFVVELENGKTAKSIPKNGADEAKYENAKKDFSDMKKTIKKIVKNRFDNLFKAFLNGRDKSASSWNTVYTTNPVLKQTAKMIVWAQNDKTFTMTSDKLIDSEGKAYTLTDEDVYVAHPMEMEPEEVERWQKYFTLHNLKQPFLQIWEPVRDPATIKEDRYAGIMIPFYRFNNQEKHGITVEDEEYHNYIGIEFKEMEAEVDRIDYARHSLDMNDRFEIQKIRFKDYTRQVNHEIAYLDRITVWDRVRKDDQTIADILPGFTLAQIMEFISTAQEANAVNVLALLMDYKNKNFADYDPMDEFTLDW